MKDRVGRLECGQLRSLHIITRPLSATENRNHEEPVAEFRAFQYINGCAYLYMHELLAWHIHQCLGIRMYVKEEHECGYSQTKFYTPAHVCICQGKLT